MTEGWELEAGGGRKSQSVVKHRVDEPRERKKKGTTAARQKEKSLSSTTHGEVAERRVVAAVDGQAPDAGHAAVPFLRARGGRSHVGADSIVCVHSLCACLRSVSKASRVCGRFPAHVRQSGASSSWSASKFQGAWSCSAGRRLRGLPEGGSPG